MRGEDGEWYENSPVGPHPLESFMKRISKEAGLSQSYTNHCIRATVITNLDDAGFEARHIKAVSGHKSDETIKNYAVRCPENKKREMSDALSNRLNSRKIPPTSTVSVPPTEQTEKFETINFDDIVDFIPIDNNADDFDITNVLSEVSNREENVAKTSEIAIQSEKAMAPIQQNIPVMPQVQVPNIAFTPQNNIMNVTQANSFPLIPQMYFPNSNVTINYNINNPK